MSGQKTKPTSVDARTYLKSVVPERRRLDGLELLDLMQKVTGQEPVMWGPSIIGFGRYRYTYKSGHSGEWMMTGFAPRKQNLVVYVMPGFKAHDGLLQRLGKHKTGRSCLYINKLADVDMTVLERLIAAGYAHMKKTYGVAPGVSK